MEHLNRRRTEITIETLSITTIRTRGRLSDFCKICGENFNPVSGTEAGDAVLVVPPADGSAAVGEESPKGDPLTAQKDQSGGLRL